MTENSVTLRIEIFSFHYYYIHDFLKFQGAAQGILSYEFRNTNETTFKYFLIN